MIVEKGRLLKDITKIEIATKGDYGSNTLNAKSVSQGGFSSTNVSQNTSGVNPQSMQTEGENTQHAVVDPAGRRRGAAVKNNAPTSPDDRMDVWHKLQNEIILGGALYTVTFNNDVKENGRTVNHTAIEGLRLAYRASDGKRVSQKRSLVNTQSMQTEGENTQHAVVDPAGRRQGAAVKNNAPTSPDDRMGVWHKLQNEIIVGRALYTVAFNIDVKENGRTVSHTAIEGLRRAYRASDGKRISQNRSLVNT